MRHSDGKHRIWCLPKTMNKVYLVKRVGACVCFPVRIFSGIITDLRPYSINASQCPVLIRVDACACVDLCAPLWVGRVGEKLRVTKSRKEKAAAFCGRMFVWVYVAVDKCGCTGLKPTAEYHVHNKERNEPIWSLGQHCTYRQHECVLRYDNPPEERLTINYDVHTFFSQCWGKKS